jgi:hypothetical protein
MPIDDIDRAWVRFVALRDQLIAARDEENANRAKVTLPEPTEPAPAQIDLRNAVANPRRTRMTDRRARRA